MAEVRIIDGPAVTGKRTLVTVRYRRNSSTSFVSLSTPSITDKIGQRNYLKE